MYFKPVAIWNLSIIPSAVFGRSWNEDAGYNSLSYEKWDLVQEARDLMRFQLKGEVDCGSLGGT